MASYTIPTTLQDITNEWAANFVHEISKVVRTEKGKNQQPKIISIDITTNDSSSNAGALSDICHVCVKAEVQPPLYDMLIEKNIVSHVVADHPPEFNKDELPESPYSQNQNVIHLIQNDTDAKNGAETNVSWKLVSYNFFVKIVQ